jgi:hypothetical protein
VVVSDLVVDAGSHALVLKRFRALRALDGEPVPQVSYSAWSIDRYLPFAAEQVRQLSVETNLQIWILPIETPRGCVSAEETGRSTAAHTVRAPAKQGESLAGTLAVLSAPWGVVEMIRTGGGEYWAGPDLSHLGLKRRAPGGDDSDHF